MGPDVLILDIAQSIIDFRAEIEDLGLSSEMPLVEIVREMIPYLQDEFTVHGALLEYTSRLGEMLSNRYCPETIEDFVYAVNELGSDIIYQLQDLVAYDDVGALWYDFGGLCGDDIVLVRSTLSQPFTRTEP